MRLQLQFIQSTVTTTLILKIAAISKRTFLLGAQLLDAVEYRDKYYFRKTVFSGRALALSSYAKDISCGIDCFLVEEGQEFSLWQALPAALSDVIEEVEQD